MMSNQRSRLIHSLRNETFDLLVIGGGATGAGIALDAAARGLKTALVEKQDFASGTSSKSTKLIHGGLRYLKQFELGLVREVGRERAIVHRLAPHLVRPEKMLLPLVEGSSLGKRGASLGLWLYDTLAGVKGEDRRRMLSAQQTLAEEPLLQKDGLLGGGLYAEYRTDDARLTIEIVKTAARHGAVCLNYVRAGDFNYENGKVKSVVCSDELTGETMQIEARCIVNAAGPWADQVRQSDHSRQGRHLFLSKGIHIVVPAERLPIRHAVYFDTPDKRMIFAIPRHRTTYIGTTDTAYTGDTDNVFAEPSEVDYLLKCTNAMFPSAKLTPSDVESSWAGLRPLIYKEGKKAGEMSRKEEIIVSPSSLITIAGGKLTGYRMMAEQVVNLVVKKLGQKAAKQFSACQTMDIPLTEGPFGSMAEVADFQETVLRQIEALHIPSFYAAYLVENYGNSAGHIIEQMRLQHKTGEEALVESELFFALEQEFVIRPADFLDRRTGRLYFNIASVKRCLEPVLSIFQRHFQFGSDQLEKERINLLNLIRNAEVFQSRCPAKC